MSSDTVKYYCAYHGTGSVFAAIAKSRNGSSAYIPAVSYACENTDGVKSCFGTSKLGDNYIILFLTSCIYKTFKIKDFELKLNNINYWLINLLTN